MMRTHPPLATFFRRCATALPLLFAAVPAVRAADGPTGEQIYRDRCASCHGAQGEGTKDHYDRPLAGEKSQAQLVRLIAKSMPKDKPGSCTGADAERVAGYIYDAFYSKTARIELSRLTVRQHQNAVADLIASFRTPGKWGDERGLRGEYFPSHQFKHDQRVLERLDAELRFDFKDGSPDAKIQPEEFAVRWQGSVLASETGDYEFVVKSQNGVRLWVNDMAKPLIDGWVRSGTEIELREPVRLLGGRAYPLKLEFYKSKEAKEKTASVALEWKPPGGVAGPIPPADLSPNKFPETLVTTAAFPPDDRSQGWERGSSVSKTWDQAATDAALEAAGYVTAHLKDLAGARDGAADRDAKLREFCRKFAERAFRRPLTDDQKRLFIDRQFEAAPDPDAAVKRVVLLVLLSPRFLYREVGGGNDAYDTASRLAFGLWDSLPDQELLDAAAAGKLATHDDVARQAERMLADPRAHAKLREFFHVWLRIDPAPELSKDAERFPGFDAAVAADLRASLDLSLDDAAWSGDSDFRRLLLSDELYLNGRLAKFYGADLPADAAFQKVTLDAKRRAGVLTHPYMAAAFAHTSASSPIHRGVFLARGVLGLTLRPPPEAFTPLAESLHPDLTTRERVALQTKPASCQSCHGVINPLGYTLEHFDAVGRWRDQDNGKPVDSTGLYETRAGEAVKFAGARELAEFLAGSEEVQTAFAEQLFRHLAKQPVQAYGRKRPAELREYFAGHGCSIQKLMVEEATVFALTGREDKPPGPERTGPPGG
jgi:hypothetical protein